MRTRDAYLIIRFLTWPPAIIGIAGLMALGFVVQVLGLDKPNHPEDLVCLGAKSYDLNEQADKDDLIQDMSGWDVLPSKVLQRPPCDNAGGSVSAASINKIYKRTPPGGAL